MNYFFSNKLLINNIEIASLRSSFSTQTKIQIKQLAWTWIRVRPELAGAFKSR